MLTRTNLEKNGGEMGKKEFRCEKEKKEVLCVISNLQCDETKSGGTRAV